MKLFLTFLFLLGCAASQDIQATWIHEENSYIPIPNNQNTLQSNIQITQSQIQITQETQDPIKITEFTDISVKQIREIINDNVEMKNEQTFVSQTVSQIQFIESVQSQQGQIQYPQEQPSNEEKQNQQKSKDSRQENKKQHSHMRHQRKKYSDGERQGHKQKVRSNEETFLQDDQQKNQQQDQNQHSYWPDRQHNYQDEDRHQSHGRKHHKKFKMAKHLFFIGVFSLLIFFLVRRCMKKNKKKEQNSQGFLLKNPQIIQAKINQHYLAIQKLEVLKRRAQQINERPSPILFYQNSYHYANQNGQYSQQSREYQNRQGYFNNQFYRQPLNQRIGQRQQIQMNRRD